MKMSELIGFLNDPAAHTITYNGSKVTYLDEVGTPGDNGKFFIAGHEFGATHLIHVESYRGDGFGTAWEAWIDNSATIPEDELVEALGIDGESFIDLAMKESRSELDGVVSRYSPDECNAWLTGCRARAKALLLERDEDAEIIEGYEYQSNASGTGIVDVGHYSWMREADLDAIEVTRK